MLSPTQITVITFSLIFATVAWGLTQKITTCFITINIQIIFSRLKNLVK
jgi:hypothetical protein